MKKNLTLALLSALTIAGGSWLAAQQDETPRAAKDPNNVASAGSPAEGGPRPAREPRARALAQPRYARPAEAFDENQARGEDWAQPPTVTINGTARFPQQFGNGFPGQAFSFAARGPMSPEDAARMREFQDAIRELREAKDDEEKKEARDKVTQLVSDQLDADLANREEELAAIEQRAKELRKQLDERKTAKPELLKMLIMLIDNPQVGLGIPPEWMQMLMRGSNSINSIYPSKMPGESVIYPFENALPPQPGLPPQPAREPH